MVNGISFKLIIIYELFSIQSFLLEMIVLVYDIVLLID